MADFRYEDEPALRASYCTTCSDTGWHCALCNEPEAACDCGRSAEPVACRCTGVTRRAYDAAIEVAQARGAERQMAEAFGREPGRLQ